MVVGGFGGLGRTITRWLVDSGARNIVLVSRGGTQSQMSKDLLTELKKRNVRVCSEACDIADSEKLENLLDRVRAMNMPQIRGVIQGAMVLRVSNLGYCFHLVSPTKLTIRIHHSKVCHSATGVKCFGQKCKVQSTCITCYRRLSLTSSSSCLLRLELSGTGDKPPMRQLPHSWTHSLSTEGKSTSAP